MTFTTESETGRFTVPALRRIIFLSAVKILVGRINEFTGKVPDENAEVERGIDRLSFGTWLVIWQRIISSPCRSESTNAGRFFEPDRSEKGNGMITTSPFTNLSMPDLLLGSASL